MAPPIAQSLWLVVVGFGLGTVGTAVLAVYTVLNSDGDRTLQAFAVLLTSLVVWTGGIWVRTITPSTGGKLFWHGFAYVGIATAPVAWFAFVLLYTGRSEYVRRETVAVLLAVPVTTLAVLYTNGWHHLFYESIDRTFVGATPILDPSAGPFWWGQFAISYLLVLLGIVLIASFALSVGSLYRTQTAALLLAGVAPLAANVVTIFEVPFDPVVDVTPLSFVLSSVLLFVSVFYGRFLDFVPVGDDAVLRTLEDGVVVVEADGRIVNANPAAARIFAGNHSGSLVGERLAAVEPTLGALLEGGSTNRRAGVDRGFEVGRVVDGETEWFWVRISPLDTPGRTDRTVVTLTDISENKRFERRVRRLHRTHRRLVAAESEAEVASIAVEAAKRILGLPITGIWKHDEKRSVLEPVEMTAEADAITDERPTFRAGESLAWRVFRSGELRRISDLQEASRVHNPETDLRSEVLIPVGDWGVIVTGSTDRTAFEEFDPYLLQLLGGAVENALANTERERRVQRLQRRTSSFVRASSAEAIAEEVVDTADDVLGLSLTGVHLLSEDDHGKVLEPAAVTPTVRDEFDTLPRYRRNGDTEVEAVLWDVFETDGTFVVEDVDDADERFGDSPVRSAIVHALGDHGVLIASSPEPGGFDRTDRALAELLATTATAALDRAGRERELRESQRELRRQNDRLEEFTSVVSHDLRSPLNQATLYLEMLESEFDDDRIGSALGATRRAERMVDDLLRLASQGKTVEGTESVAVERTVRNAWGSISTDGLTLTVEDELGTVSADPPRLRQVFENLFRNAAEHGGSEVRVGTTAEGGLFVADDGPGIPADTRDEVFDHGYTTQASGTGFGLAIVQRIVEAHGWRIRVTDAAGGGARFEITGTSPGTAGTSSAPSGSG